MATTTNYGWETPDDTDLVKDGALAIRTLGSSVDTTVKALNPETTLGDIAYRSSTANTNTRLAIGTSGQVLTVSGGVPTWATPSVSASGLTLIGETSFTSSTSVNINNVFSATYKDYRFVLVCTSTTVNSAAATLRFRVSGTDTTTNYVTQEIYSYDTTIACRKNLRGTDEIYLGDTEVSSNYGSAFTGDICSPFLSQETVLNSFGFQQSTPVIKLMGGALNNTTSYTGLTLLFTDTCTGKIAIYGYAKA